MDNKLGFILCLAAAGAMSVAPTPSFAQEFFRDLGTSRSSGGIGPVTPSEYTYRDSLPSGLEEPEADKPALDLFRALETSRRDGRRSVANRVALLIANSRYRDPVVGTSGKAVLPVISSPMADLLLMKKTLESANFACAVLFDRTTAEMRADVVAFAAACSGAPIVLFYYSGHGLQQDGVNYLAGVDAQIDVSDQVKPLEQANRTGALSEEGLAGAIAALKRRRAAEQLLPLEEVLGSLHGMSSKLGDRKIVLLDACRNPFVLSGPVQTPMAAKSAAVVGNGAAGFSSPAARRGTFIAFSAEAGKYAPDLNDRPSEPSLFTAAFCREALEPGTVLGDAFDKTAMAVYQESLRLLQKERAPAPAAGQQKDGVLAPEAQTPVSYALLFPSGFAFIPNGEQPVLQANSSLPSNELALWKQQEKIEFERANFRECETLDQKILTQEPNNLEALEDLGAVCFRRGDFTLANGALKKALAVAPEDSYSHSMLGVVYYAQKRYDDAELELTMAAVINGDNELAHLTAAENGSPEAAQKELEKATSLEHSYADARFNLAVFFATERPPNKEAANSSYKLALSLGAAPDLALEKLLK